MKKIISIVAMVLLFSVSAYGYGTITLGPGGTATLGDGGTATINPEVEITRDQYRDIYYHWMGPIISNGVQFRIEDINVENIVEFAIANPIPTEWSSAYDYEAGWESFNASKGPDGKWYAGDRSLEWLDNTPSFNNYQKAYLYTTYNGASFSIANALQPGYTTDNFAVGLDSYPLTFFPASQFAILTLDNNGIENQSITGLTHIGLSVPEPATMLLLGLGLIGLAGIRRKIKK